MNSSKSFLSIIIPTRDRVENLRVLFPTIFSQRRIRSIREILLIDNGSTRPLSTFINEVAESSPVPIKHVQQPLRGLHFSRNLGASVAQGDVLAFLDDDMLLSPDWSSGANLIKSGHADCVAGRTYPKWETSPPRWLNALCSSGTFGALSIMDLGDSPRRISGKEIFGNNFFVKRDVVIKLKGFNPDSFPPALIKFRGDGETGFGRKLDIGCYKTFYFPQAVGFHCIPKTRLTEDYLCKRFFNEGITLSFCGFRENRSSPNWDLRIFKPAFPGSSIRSSCLRRIVSSVFENLFRVFLSHEFREIEEKVIQAYKDGYFFHRKLVANEPFLREYVFSSDFWDPPPFPNPFKVAPNM